MASQSSCAGVGPGGRGEQARHRVWVHEGGWKVAQAAKEAHQLQQQGAGPKAWAEGVKRPLRHGGRRGTRNRGHRGNSNTRHVKAVLGAYLGVSGRDGRRPAGVPGPPLNILGLGFSRL